MKMSWDIWDSPDAEIVAVCDRNEEAAGEWLLKWKLPRARFYKNYEDMLEKEELDLVEILTPTAFTLSPGGEVRRGQSEGHQPAEAHGQKPSRM